MEVAGAFGIEAAFGKVPSGGSIRIIAPQDWVFGSAGAEMGGALPIEARLQYSDGRLRRPFFGTAGQEPTNPYNTKAPPFTGKPSLFAGSDLFISHFIPVCKTSDPSNSGKSGAQFWYSPPEGLLLWPSHRDCSNPPGARRPDSSRRPTQPHGPLGIWRATPTAGSQPWHAQKEYSILRPIEGKRGGRMRNRWATQLRRASSTE